jgi:hypothetical protein
MYSTRPANPDAIRSSVCSVEGGKQGEVVGGSKIDDDGSCGVSSDRGCHDDGKIIFTESRGVVSGIFDDFSGHDVNFDSLAFDTPSIPPSSSSVASTVSLCCYCVSFLRGRDSNALHWEKNILRNESNSRMIRCPASSQSWAEKLKKRREGEEGSTWKMGQYLSPCNPLC